jgi:hypothetical protein
MNRGRDEIIEKIGDIDFIIAQPDYERLIEEK